MNENIKNIIEYWRTTLNDQFLQLGVSKTAYAGRLAALRYDDPEKGDDKTMREVYILILLIVHISILLLKV